MKLDTHVQYSTSAGILTGVLVGIQRVDTTVWDTETDQEWPGIRFQVRDDKTGERRWTPTYPDKELKR